MILFHKAGTHAKGCLFANSHKVEVNTTETEKTVDCMVAMHQFLEEQCTNNEYKSFSPK